MDTDGHIRGEGDTSHFGHATSTMEHMRTNKYNSSSLSYTLLEFREVCLTPQALPAYRSFPRFAVLLNTEQRHQHATQGVHLRAMTLCLLPYPAEAWRTYGL